MSILAYTVDILKKEEVKKYFLSTLENKELDNLRKYEEFINFFTSIVNMEKAKRSLELNPGQKIIIEKELLESVGNTQILKKKLTKLAIERAIGHIIKTRNDDGGWGVNSIPGTLQRSDCWGTGYAMLCLNAAKGLEGFNLDFNKIDIFLKEGKMWLERNPKEWSVDFQNMEIIDIKTYEMSLVIRCFYDLGLNSIDDEFSSSISSCLDKLLNSQNSDGGWDARIWAKDTLETATRIWSDVGATSGAVRCLEKASKSGINNERITGVIQDGVKWLINTQNKDGSWNFGVCNIKVLKNNFKDPNLVEQLINVGAAVIDNNEGNRDYVFFKITDEDLRKRMTDSAKFTNADMEDILNLFKQAYENSYRLVGDVSVNTTCSALKGIVIGRMVIEEQYNDEVNKAVEWLLSNRMITSKAESEQKKWGRFDYENTFLALEALLLVPILSLPICASYVKWLLDTQKHYDNDRYGYWDAGHSSRITYALIKYYENIV